MPPALLGMPLHPTQLYLMIANLAVFALGFALLRKKMRTGVVFSAVAISYSILRFIIEFYRGDVARGFVIDEMLSSGQFFCICWLLIGVYAAVNLRE